MAEYFSNDFNCGYALQPNETTSATITSAHFPHGFLAEPTKVDAPGQPIKCPTINGTVAVLNGKVTTTIPDSTMQINGLEGPFFVAAGFTSAASGYRLGAPLSGATNASRTSVNNLTLVQYGGESIRFLRNAKPATFSLNIKSGEVVTLKQSFQGVGDEVSTNGFPFIKVITTAAPANSLGISISLSGQTVNYSEASLDLGVNLQQIDDASDATGLGSVEIVGYDPKFTINPASNTSTRAFFATLKNNTVVPVVITMSANAKTYTISFNAYLESLDISKDGEIRIQNQVWGVVAQNDSFKTLVNVAIS